MAGNASKRGKRRPVEHEQKKKTGLAETRAEQCACICACTSVGVHTGMRNVKLP